MEIIPPIFKSIDASMYYIFYIIDKINFFFFFFYFFFLLLIFIKIFFYQLIREK